MGTHTGASAAYHTGSPPGLTLSPWREGANINGILIESFLSQRSRRLRHDTMVKVAVSGSGRHIFFFMNSIEIPTGLYNMLEENSFTILRGCVRTTP